MKHVAFLLLTLASLFGQNPPVHPAWNGDKIHEIRLQFKQADYWDQLTKNYLGTEQDATYLEASLQWGEYKFDSVGVRFKGNSSYRVSTNKKPFRIKLNEFVKGQKIEGIGAFNLSNGFMDASLVREPLYYEMSTALGLKSPRTNYAALYINDQYWGLYVLGEVVNSDFLKNYFGSKEDTGNLYKANIGAVFTYLGEDKATYKAVWEKQTNEEADDWSDIIELCRIIGQTAAADLPAKLEPLMDVDSFLTAIALDNATVNLDSYVGMGQNFNIYRRPSDNKWVWIVWDPSLAFGAFGGGQGGGTTSTQLATEYVQTGGGFGGGGGGGAVTGRPLASKLWEVPAYKERYRQIYKNILDRLYNPQTLVARANTLRTMIRSYVDADPNKLNTTAQFDAAMTGTAAGGGQPGQGGANAPGLQTFIEGRATWLRTQFASQTLPSAALAATTPRLTFTGADSAAQTVDLKFSGVNTSPTWSAYSATSNGGNWLKMNVTSGPLPGGFTVTVDAKSLAPGAYEGTVTVYLGGAAPVVVPVSLTIGTLPQPALSAVVNAASYATGAIAANEIVTLFGTNLGSTGLTITFDGVAAQVLYNSATQAGAIVPAAVAGKSQSAVVVAYGAQASAAVTKSIADAAPGLFTTNASGSGPGAIVNQTGTVNSAAAPAAKGTIVAIYLTGGGVTMSTANTTVTIGGQAATLAYAGIAPGITGLNQINATIPAATPGGAQPLAVSIAGVAAQSGVTINVQ